MYSKLLCFVVYTTSCLSGVSVTEAQTIGSNMVTFLKGKLNTRVGSGECAPMATEALRVAGGEFYPADLGADYPSSGDYVWGTLVTVISYSTKWSDSNPTNACLPGDVLQFGGGCKIGTTTYPTHHTAVCVAVTSTTHRPNSVYQQNFNGVRTVQQSSIDLTKLTAGWVRIYRPVPVIIRTNEWKFTVVNNTSSSQSIGLWTGTTELGVISESAANSAGSFYVLKVDTSGTVPNLALSTGQSIFLQTQKGFQVYNPTSSSVGLGQLTQ